VAPDRVTTENVVYVVQEHDRRLSHIEERTEDLGVMKADVQRLRDSVHGLRGDVQAVAKQLTLYATETDVKDVKKDVDGMRRALYTFAISIAGSALMFSLTLFAIFK